MTGRWSNIEFFSVRTIRHSNNINCCPHLPDPTQNITCIPTIRQCSFTLVESLTTSSLPAISSTTIFNPSQSTFDESLNPSSLSFISSPTNSSPAPGVAPVVTSGDAENGRGAVSSDSTASGSRGAESVVGSMSPGVMALIGALLFVALAVMVVAGFMVFMRQKNRKRLLNMEEEAGKKGGGGGGGGEVAQVSATASWRETESDTPPPALTRKRLMELDADRASVLLAAAYSNTTRIASPPPPTPEVHHPSTTILQSPHLPRSGVTSTPDGHLGRTIGPTGLRSAPAPALVLMEESEEGRERPLSMILEERESDLESE
ncbi:hypothetical protein HDU67_007090, partial [Dinochytrium kinnereticum]